MIAKDGREWPFIIVRCYGTGERNPRSVESIFEANERHPGLVNEIWFGGSTLDGVDVMRNLVQNDVAYRERCEKLGIQFSFQQGATLNHGPDFKPRPHFPEDAWMMDCQGTRLVGMLCPTSPDAKKYNYEVAKMVMETLHPASYWPDDDLRVSLRAGKAVCFCERCIAKFNQRFQHDFTRETLSDALFGEHSQEDLTIIRGEWIQFNAEVLGEFSPVYRRAADEAAPECRLGIQTVFADCTYDGWDFRPLLEGFASEKYPVVGIRPGSGYYCEREGLTRFNKALYVMREAARCNKYGFVGQICYEAENWPHVAAQKSPLSQMNECALVLASGADSLALYFAADANTEPPEIARFYFDTLAKYRPYFEKIVAAFKDTTAAGGALYCGSQFLGTPNWMNRDDITEIRLEENAVPVCVTEAIPEFFVLNNRRVDSLGKDDLPVCFAKNVLMDINAWNELGKRYPELDFLKKIEICSDMKDAMAVSTSVLKEDFNGCQATNVIAPIKVKSTDVKTFSGIVEFNDLCGTCVIPTAFGGSVVLIQSLDFFCLWTTYRRKAILDALDCVVPGGVSVRLLTGGFSVLVYSRVNADGKTAGVYLENINAGDTLANELAIRRPVSRKWRIARVGMSDADTQVLRENDTEVILSLPPLAPRQSMLIFPC